jgi:transcription elongation factor Elf1
MINMKTSITQYKCPNCKHLIPLSTADFIKGIAMVSCLDCGRDAFTFEETLSVTI